MHFVSLISDSHVDIVVQENMTRPRKMAFQFQSLKQGCEQN